MLPEVEGELIRKCKAGDARFYEPLELRPAGPDASPERVRARTAAREVLAAGLERVAQGHRCESVVPRPAGPEGRAGGARGHLPLNPEESRLRDPLTHEDLMRYLDGELPPEEEARVEAELTGSTELQREIAIYRAMRDDLRQLSFTVEEEATVWDRVNRRIARPIGWMLVIVGAAMWTGYGAFLFATSSVDRWEKLSVGALSIGFALLLESTIWERYRDWTSDPYRHVHR